MKKIVAIALFAFVTSAVVGCNSASTTSTGVTKTTGGTSPTN